MRCKNCGAEISDNAYFCANCGALNKPEEKMTGGGNPSFMPPEPPRRTLSCPQCGNGITEVDDFCPQCGASLKKRFYKPAATDTGGNKKVFIAIIAALSVAVIASIAVAAAVIYRPEPTPDPDPTAQPFSTASATSVPLPTLEPAVTLAPTPTPTVKPTATPAASKRYEVVVSHITWEGARSAAQSKGGHLVTIQDQQEFNEVTSLFSGSKYSKVKNVWIGACAPAGINSKSSAESYWYSSEAQWITGEPFTFAKWRSGEPSGYDSQLATAERYLQMFRPAKDGGVWSYNDAGDDLSEYKESTLAYVIEYE